MSTADVEDGGANSHENGNGEEGERHSEDDDVAVGRGGARVGEEEGGDVGGKGGENGGRRRCRRRRKGGEKWFV